MTLQCFDVYISLRVLDYVITLHCIGHCTTGFGFGQKQGQRAWRSGWEGGWASSFGSFTLKLVLLRLLTQAFNCSCSRFPSTILTRGEGRLLVNGVPVREQRTVKLTLNSVFNILIF